MGLNNLKFIILLPVLLISIAILSGATFAALYVNTNVQSIRALEQLNNTTNALAKSFATISGALQNSSTSDDSSGLGMTNVTGCVGSLCNWTIANSSGNFNFTLLVSPVLGPYNFTISTNSSSIQNKTIPITITSELGSASSIAYHGKFPPYTAGTTFTINVTLKNSTTLLSGILPNVSIYSTNSGKLSWTITNLSASTNSNGLIQFNITVPSGTSAGTYAVVIDNGAFFSTFEVGSGYVIAVQTLTSSNEASSFFPPSSSVMVLAKVRDTSGNPVTGATLTGIVTYPNGTTGTSFSLSEQSSSGYYNNNFTDTSSAGTYKIKVTATISGTTITSNGIFNTQKFTASLQPQKTFFFQWGGQGSFKPNSTFVLDITPINLTDGSTLTQASCPTSSYSLVDVGYANGSSILTTIYNYTFILSTTPSGSLCSIKFGNNTANSNILAGVYNVKVNVSLAGEYHVVSSFITVQGYFLKATPTISLGGEDDFMQVAAPGSNLTIALKAINTNGSSILPADITNFLVTSIVPLEFTGGASETTTISQTSVSGSNPSTDPTINLVLPSGLLGPLLVKIQANISSANQLVTGDAFIIANYLLGGVSPQGITVEGFGNEGPGKGGAEGGAALLCSGTKTFNGNVQDATTATAAQGATAVGIVQAREAETGKDVSSYLSVAGSTASDSNGAFTVNMTFDTSSYSFAGDYFMVLNATYKNVSAGVPGFFQCKNLNIGFPTIRSVGTISSSGFFVSPNSGINMSLTNVTNMTGSIINASSTLYISNIFNFNPGTGSMRILANNTPLVANFTNSSGTIRTNLVFYPQNFSVGGVALTKWPNGFFDARPTVKASITGASTPVTDISHGGFQVVPFNAFPESFGFGSASVGSVQSTIIDIQANGTYNNADSSAWNSTIYTSVNNTFVNITIGRPWEGELISLTNVNATLMTDGWNKSSDSNNFANFGFGQSGPFERWNITYFIPTTVRKGFAMLTITVNATTNGSSGFGQVDIPLALSVTKYNIILPSQEGVGDQSGGSQFDGFGVYYWPNSTNPPGTDRNVNESAFGSWNATYLSINLGLNSSSSRVCVKNQFNSSRYGNGPQLQVRINNTTSVMLLDRTLPGVYDTIVLNMTSGSNTGSIVILNSSQRNISVPSGSGGVYLWSIDNCGYFTVVNTTARALAPTGSFSPSYGGSHQTNNNFVIPYVVSLGSASNPAFQSGNTIGIKGIGQQNPGKNGGFGFTGKLVAGTDFTATGGTTDANGIAFVTVNVSKTGQFMAFWNATISGDTDAADFSSATFFDARAFNAYTNIIDSSGIYKVTLFNNATGSGGAFTAADGIYNGTLGTLFVEYKPSTQKIAINFNSPTSMGGDRANNQSYSANDGNNYNIAWITGNTTGGVNQAANNQTILIYKSANFQTGVVSVKNSTQNVTISICGQAFTGNPPAVLASMAVNNITTQDWSKGGTLKTLTIYELMNSTNATSNGVSVGPAGCALLNIGPGQLGTWPSSSGFAPPVFANAYITNGANSQQIYAANIFKT